MDRIPQNSLLLGLIIIMGIIGFFCGRKSVETPENAIIRDTVTVVRTDTVEKAMPTPVYTRIVDSILVAVTDTIIRNDTTYLELPMERKVYEDSTYRAVVSGYKPNLDSLWLYRTTRTITITNTVQAPRRRFGFSVTAGPSVMITPFTKSRLDAGFGITGGVSYNF